MTRFRVLRERGQAAALFGVGPAAYGGVPTVVERRVLHPALVLGSTQQAAVRADAAVDVVRRRSGGGAVLVEPDDVVWVDVFVPAADPLWAPDVGQAFWWLGDAWAQALAGAGVAGDIEVHRGALAANAWSGLVCFAGLGPGEVTADGRKAVGMAQRRTREGSLFQCAVARSWRPARLLTLFEWPLAQFGPYESALTTLADAVAPVAASADDCFAALVDALP